MKRDPPSPAYFSPTGPARVQPTKRNNVARSPVGGIQIKPKPTPETQLSANQKRFLSSFAGLAQQANGAVKVQMGVASPVPCPGLKSPYSNLGLPFQPVIKPRGKVSKKSRSSRSRDLGGGKWTSEEDRKLREGVNAVGPTKWKRISDEYLGGKRSDVQCLHRWQKVLRPGLVKGPWKKEEDAMIIKCLKENITKWSTIAGYIPGRIGKQCRERWFNHLDPTINREPWSEEEEKLLVTAQAELGNKWSEIARLLPGRPENQVKNKWNSAARKKWQQKLGLVVTDNKGNAVHTGSSSSAKLSRSSTSKKKKKAKSKKETSKTQPAAISKVPTKRLQPILAKKPLSIAAAPPRVYAAVPPIIVAKKDKKAKSSKVKTKKTKKPSNRRTPPVRKSSGEMSTLRVSPTSPFSGPLYKSVEEAMLNANWAADLGLFLEPGSMEKAENPKRRSSGRFSDTDLLMPLDWVDGIDPFATGNGIASLSLGESGDFAYLSGLKASGDLDNFDGFAISPTARQLKSVSSSFKEGKISEQQRDVLKDRILMTPPPGDPLFVDM